MKIVINTDWGGFEIPEEMIKPLGLGPHDYYDDRISIRTNPLLVEWVEQNDSDLGVAVIPDEATDWELEEYDGRESIIAVVDGKLRHIYAER